MIVLVKKLLFKGINIIMIIFQKMLMTTRFLWEVILLQYMIVRPRSTQLQFN